MSTPPSQMPSSASTTPCTLCPAHSEGRFTTRQTGVHICCSCLVHQGTRDANNCQTFSSKTMTRCDGAGQHPPQYVHIYKDVNCGIEGKIKVAHASHLATLTEQERRRIIGTAGSNAASVRADENRRAESSAKRRPDHPRPARRNPQLPELRPAVLPGQSQSSYLTSSSTPPQPLYRPPQQPSHLSEMPPPPRPVTTFGVSSFQYDRASADRSSTPHTQSFMPFHIDAQSQRYGGSAPAAAEEGSGPGTLPDNQATSGPWFFQGYRVEPDGSYHDTYPPGTRSSDPFADPGEAGNDA